MQSYFKSVWWEKSPKLLCLAPIPYLKGFWKNGETKRARKDQNFNMLTRKYHLNLPGLSFKLNIKLIRVFDYSIGFIFNPKVSLTIAKRPRGNDLGGNRYVPVESWINFRPLPLTRVTQVCPDVHVPQLARVNSLGFFIWVNPGLALIRLYMLGILFLCGSGTKIPSRDPKFFWLEFSADH